MQNIAIITAAGSGKRLGGTTKKQYLKLNGLPILYYTIKQFQEHEEISEIVLVAPPDDIELVQKNIVEHFNFSKVKMVIAGGKERQDSIFNALNALKDYPSECNLLIQDGVRPFITKRIINAVIADLAKHQASVVGVRVKDTIKEIHGAVYQTTLDRSKLIAVQTPQSFPLGLLLDCYQKAYTENFYSTDDAALVEKYGQLPVYFTEGSYFNIKITTTEDLIFAEAILSQLSESEDYLC